MATIKKKDGWEAEDIFDFMGERKLSVRTYKYDGRLVTRASVNRYYGTGYSHAFGLGAGGDWSAHVALTTARATEKGVAAQHAFALKQVPQMLEMAKEHYTKFPPQDLS